MQPEYQESNFQSGTEKSSQATLTATEVCEELGNIDSGTSTPPAQGLPQAVVKATDMSQCFDILETSKGTSQQRADPTMSAGMHATSSTSAQAGGMVVQPTGKSDALDQPGDTGSFAHGSPPTRLLKRRYAKTKAKLVACKRKVKSLQQKNRRLTKRNASLRSVIVHLVSQNLVSQESSTILEQIGKGNADLLKRQVGKVTKRSMPKKYSPELRAFALTLHFYSPRAYKYARKAFNTCLPHPRTLMRWYSTIDGAPGFSREALNAVRAKAAESDRSGHPIQCSLLLDEMPMRQHVEWDGHIYHF